MEKKMPSFPVWCISGKKEEEEIKVLDELLEDKSFFEKIDKNELFGNYFRFTVFDNGNYLKKGNELEKRELDIIKKRTKCL